MSDEEIRYHPAVAAAYDPIQAYFERVQGPPHRRALAAGLSGDVLEVAVGTGAMAPYFGEYADSPTLHGVEPDPGMYRRAAAKLRRRDREMALVRARAEALPYPDDVFDAVVESGLLCSVPDVEGALEEVARVLETDGEFRFFDHVRSPGVVGRTQDLLSPVWERAFGNCHLDRRVGRLVEACDVLDVCELERHTVGHWPVRAFVRGVAVPTGPP